MKVKEFLASYEGKHQDFFKDFFKSSPDELNISLIEVEKGKQVMRQAYEEINVYIMYEGKAQTIIRQAKASDHAFEDFKDIAFFGEYESFGNLNYYLADVVARVDSKFICIKKADYLNWLKKDVNLLLYRMENVLKEIIRQTQLGRRSLYMPSTDRMMSYLLDYYKRLSKEENERVKVQETRSDIAQELGFHTRTVNRAIQTLEDEKLIILDKGKIVLTPENIENMQKRNIEV